VSPKSLKNRQNECNSYPKVFDGANIGEVKHGEDKGAGCLDGMLVAGVLFRNEFLFRKGECV